MKLIIENPFRILGLPSNTSEKELQKQLSIIKRYSEIGKNITSDFDFSFLGKLERNQDKVSRAASQIEQVNNKIFHALFWFIKYNQIDEIALNHLKNNDPNKAIEIWSKLTATGVVNETNFHAFNNLSTITLGLSISNGTLKPELLKMALELKLRFMTASSFQMFSSSISGNGFNANTDQFSEKFVDELLARIAVLVQNNQIKFNDVISLFSSTTPKIKKRVIEHFTLIPIRNIESKIDKASQQLKNNPKNGYKIGEKLFLDCRDLLINLKGILGINDLQYQSLANKLADEILQCSIVHFNNHKNDKEYDPGDDCYRLTKYAESVVTNGPIKHRIKESYEFIQEWIDNAPIRKEFNKVQKEIERLNNYLTNLNASTLESAEQVLEYCKPYLASILEKSGAKSEVYIGMSSLVVNVVMGITIEIFNKQADIANRFGLVTAELKTTVKRAYLILNYLMSFEMKSDLREKLNINMITISGWNSSVNPQSSGCYIATLVYGNYHHPQVKILRKFRDNILLESSVGKVIVGTYYRYSPSLVDKLKGKTTIQNIIRILLDQIIKIIK